MKDIIEEFKGQKIFVVGDLMIDEYWDCTAEKLAEEAPIPVLKKHKEVYWNCGGAAAVAEKIENLGGEVFVFGIVGLDKAGYVLKEKFPMISMDSKRCTTVKLRIMVNNQFICRVDEENTEPFYLYDPQKFDEIKKTVLKCSAIVVSDYSKGLISKSILDILFGSRIPTIVDPKGNPDLYRDCDILKPNQTYVEKYPDLYSTTIQTYGIVQTLGSKGMCIRRNGYKTIPAHNFGKVINTIGAGDTCAAVLALATAAGANVEQAAYIANLAAGLQVCQKEYITLDKLLQKAGYISE